MPVSRSFRSLELARTRTVRDSCVGKREKTIAETVQVSLGVDMGRRIRGELVIRYRVGAPMAAMIVALMFPLLIEAQQTAPAAQPTRQGPREGFISEGVPKMPDPPGPAPKRDLSGAWVGPQRTKVDPMPPMTPSGESRYKMNKPYLGFAAVAAAGGGLPPTNDPTITCDPLGFPRDLFAHAVSSRGGMLFGSAPNRIIINYEQQRVWREI